MGKLILISGPNSGGKSRYAEELVEKLPGERFYIATMQVFNAENVERIRRHRLQRQHLGFKTLELPYTVAEAETENGTVLLEDVSNLLANAFFERGGSAEAVFSDICRLCDKSRILLAVTISGLRPEDYEGETARYTEELNKLNLLLGKKASAAVSMEKGQARWIKGDINDIF